MIPIDLLLALLLPPSLLLYSPMIEAVYITNSANILLYQYIECKSAPSFANALRAVRQGGSVGKHHIISLTRKHLTILVAVIGPGNPVVPYTFAERLLSTMEFFFGLSLAASTIDRSSDTLTLILSEMLAGGYPYITDTNQLGELVPHKSLISKLLSATSDLAGTTGHSQSTLPYRWRSLNVRYTNNEMFVDVCEEASLVFQCVPDPAHAQLGLAFYSLARSRTTPTHLIGGTVSGTLLFVLHLSGQPHIQVLMNANGKRALDLASFHPCVGLAEWARLGILSFVPPDGRLTIATYAVDATDHNAVAVSVAHSMGASQSEFEIQLHLSLPVEHCTLEIEAHDPDSTIKVLRSTHGDFSTKARGVSEWRLRDLGPNVAPVLTASINLNDPDLGFVAGQCVPRNITVKYTHRGLVPSGLKVDMVKIIKGMPATIKPYKGVKYETIFKSVIRT